MATGGDRTVSVVIPVYNERETWRESLRRVAAVDLPGLRKQVVVVDDGSTDGTREALREFAAEPHGGDGVEYRVLFHERNLGKGAALRTGFASADGDIVLIHDADLEYDPSEFPRLIAPILDGTADAVYGSRFLRKEKWRGSVSKYLANRFLTVLSNMATGLRLTDMETCYKAFRRDVIARVRLDEDRFGFEPEVTAKAARLGVRVLEIPIRYEPRTRATGKKIGWKDGLNAVWCILKYGRFCPRLWLTRGREQRRRDA